MVNIDIKLMPKKSNPIDNISIEVGNKIANGIAEKVRPEWQNVSCKEHPTLVSSILFVAQDCDSPKMEKRNFCCKEHEDRFILTLK